MGREKKAVTLTSTNLASLIRGLYGRVARQLKVDPSYVSRVARGERQSDAIEASLERELKRIMKLVSRNHSGHKGAGRASKSARPKARRKVAA